ncbi:LexA family transcriptional regulator [Levilactobacillus brevis]|uniref:XRE family transcriptional regulator n=1 Tax=Levilactobacillus brevis TaxID=1580 RepID=UPI001BAD519C|nr:XRE family transcriptional regulator [Levilactobacillus brevis]MBS1006805.1 LexA family transcriptional regulator [Levilactobacillus brevis]
MNISQNIKKLRKSHGYTQNDLASILNVRPTSISAWESGRNKPLMDKITLMATLFNVSTSDIVGDTFTKNNIIEIYNKLSKTNQNKVLSVAEDLLNNQQNNNRNVIKFPKDDDTLKITASGVLSAGVGEFLDDSTKPFTVTVHKPVPSNYDYAFQINGHSMEPVYQDKQVVFVKKEDDYRDGQIIAAVMDGCAYLKKLSVVDGEATLVSLNPQYPNIKVDKENGVKVLGVVFS